LVVATQKKAAAAAQFRKCWEYSYEGVAEARLATDGTSIFMVRDASFVEAVSADTGRKVWSSDVGGQVDSNLVARDGNVMLVRRVSAGGTPSASIVALSVATGITKWSAQVGGGENFTLGIVAGNVMVIARNGSLSSFSVADGSPKWTRRIASSFSIEPVLSGSALYYVSDGVGVASLTAAVGEPKDLVKAPFAVTALALPFEETLVWGDERGIVNSFGIGSGKINWQFKSGAGISSIVRADGLLLAASNDNFLYALQPGNGDRVWKKRVSGRIRSVTPLNEETVLIETVGEKVVQLLYLKNGKPAEQIVLRDDELPVSSLALPNSKAAILSDQALYSYGYDGCTSK
jgi:outer membrane protein assembly factor BamB